MNGLSMHVKSINRMVVEEDRVIVKYLFVNMRPEQANLEETHRVVMKWTSGYNKTRLVMCHDCNKVMNLWQIRILVDVDLPNKMMIELGYRCTHCGYRCKSSTVGPIGTDIIDAVTSAANAMEQNVNHPTELDVNLN